MSQVGGETRTAVIVGHRGQDGQLLAAFLRAQGTHVIGVGRPSNIPFGPEERSVDVEDFDAVSALVADLCPDEIYYLAAHHGSSETMRAGGAAEDIRAFWRVNVAGPTNFLAAVRARHPGARILLASSCLVYPGGLQRIHEQSLLGPDTMYGATKAAALLQARSARDAGLSVWTAVLFPHESGLRPPTFVASRIIRSALAIAAGADTAITIADPDALVDWSLAKWVVEGFVGLVRQTDPDEYIFASGEGNTVGEFAEAVVSKLSLDPQRCIRVNPGQLVRPSSPRIGDPSRIGGAIGWTGRPKFNQFVSMLIDEHKDALLKTA